MAEKEKNIHAGHRQRQKDKFLEYGLDNFTDIEALELLLFYAIPQIDTNELAHELLERFGSFRSVMEADWRDIVAVKGIKKNSAALLTLVRELNRRYIRYGRKIGQKIRGAADAGEYVQTYFTYETAEKIVMLCLDGASRVVGEHVLAEGTPDRVDLPVRTLVDFALRDGAARVILAHNHLDHNAVPSNADINTTRQLFHALRLIGVYLMDHIVVADNGFVSMRESRMFDDF